MDGRGPSRSGVVFVVIAATAMLLYDLYRAGTTCQMDTSYCAATTEKNGLYTGTLRGADDRPLANTEFRALFASRGLERPRVTFTTNGRGRYCILWAYEPVFPSARVAGARSDTSLGGWLPLENEPPPNGCQEGDAGIPWHRAENFTSSWQFLTLVGLAALAIAALVVAGANWLGRKPLWSRLSVALAAVALVAHVWLWAP